MCLLKRKESESDNVRYVLSSLKGYKVVLNCETFLKKFSTCSKITIYFRYIIALWILKHVDTLNDNKKKTVPKDSHDFLTFDKLIKKNLLKR